MAGEIGGPPGLPEFSAKKEDDSSEKKKSRFSFLRPQEGEESTPPPAEFIAGPDKKEEDDEDESFAGRFMKAFGGKATEGVKVDAVAAKQPETTEEAAEETPVETEQAVAPIDATSADVPEDTTEYAAPLPEMPAEVVLEDTEPAEEVPFEIAEDFTEEESEPLPDDEPEEVEAESVAPVETDIESPEDETEEEPEDEDTSTTTGSRRGSSSGSVLPGMATALGAAAPLAAEAAKASPNTATPRTSNALPLIALGTAAYANHKANKARREVETEQKSRESQMKEIAEAQAAQQQELQRRLNQLNMAPNLITVPAAEAAKPATTEAEESKPIEEATARTAPEFNVVSEKPPEVPPPLPLFEQEQPVIPSLETTEITSVPEATIEKPEEKTKVAAPEKTPSVGDILAERTPLVRGTEGANEITQEQSVEIPGLETVNVSAADLLELKQHRDPSAELYRQQIEAAAEHGVAMENQYERQHEIKDVSSVSTSSGVVGASSPIVTDDLFRKDSPDDMAQYVRANYDGSSTTYQQASNARLRADYKKAMVRGAAGAGAIIISSIIWAIL